MRKALAVLLAGPLAGLFCTGCGTTDHIADLASDHAECYHTGSATSDGPFKVAIKRFPNPVVPMLNYKPAGHKAGATSTNVKLTNTSSGLVTVQGALSGYLIDEHGHVVSAWPNSDGLVAHALVPLKPGRSRTYPVNLWMERCNAKPGHSLPAGHYRMRVQIIYTVGKLTANGKVKTIDSTTTVPVVLR